MPSSSIITRITSILITSLSFSLPPAAQAADPLVVSLVVNISDYKTMRPLIEKWSAETGNAVEIIETNATDYPTTYVLAAKTKSPRIDVIAFWDYYTSQFAPFLVPLDGSEDKAIDIAAINPDGLIKNAITPYRGHIYSMPFSLDVRLLYYRKDLLAEAGFQSPPSTWDELVKVAQATTKDTDGDGVTDQWGFGFIARPDAIGMAFFDFLSQAGGQIVDENGKIAFDSPQGIEALQFMVDLNRKYKVLPPDVTTYDSNGVHTAFLAGKIAMANHWPYMLAMAEGSDLAGKVGYAREPRPANGEYATGVNTWGFGIMQMSDKKRQAWDLLQYLTSQESGTFEFEHLLDWPLRKSVYEAAEARDAVPAQHWEFSQFLFKIADEDGKVSRPPLATEYANIVGAEMDKAMHGKISPADALSQARKKLESRLK